MRIVNWHPEIITEEIEKRAMDRLEKAAEDAAAIARRNFPLDEPPPVVGRNRKKSWMPMSKGDLLKSVRVRRLKGDPKLNIRVYAGGRWKDAPFYAHMIEYGTAKMGARPFMRRALSQSKQNILNIMENG